VTAPRVRRALVDDGPARVLLIVDFKNVVYRSVSMHDALFHARVFTGGLYGFIAGVLRAVRDVGATRVVVATDSPPYVRRTQFDGYKGDRKQRPDDDPMLLKGAQSMKLIRELLALLNVPLWALDGFEYDDLCAWAVRTLSPRFDRVVAMTNDSDLFQLFDVDNFAVHRGAAKGVYGRKEFVAEYGDISAAQWVDVLSMTGTHNAVPGIGGIGPKTAMRALHDPALLRDIMSKHAATIKRNRALITLPHASLPSDPGHRVARHTIDLRRFDSFCARYAIRPTARMLEALDDLMRAN
jgi:DNA polymerase-1